MASKNILRFGVPVATQGSQAAWKIPPKGAGVARHQTGACGIDPYKPAPPPPPKVSEKFPQHLLRPPCLKGSDSQDAKFPPTCSGLSGFYCPPERLKYKYPPFSENIDFLPSGQTDCWWAKPRTCDPRENEEELPSITRL